MIESAYPRNLHIGIGSPMPQMAAAKFSLLALVGLLVPVLLLVPIQSRGGDVNPQPLQAADDWPMYGAAADHSFTNAGSPPDALGLIWSFPASGPANGPLGGASAVEADGFVYIADFDRTLPPSGPQLFVYKVAEGNGSFVTGWSALINVPVSSSIPDSAARGIPRSLAVSGNLLYVLFTAGNESANREVVVALNVATGTQQWAFAEAETWTDATAEGTRSAPVLGSGILVFGSQNGNLYALNPSTGVPIWWIPVGAPVQTVPAIVGNRVYVTAGTRLKYFDVQGKVPADDPPTEPPGSPWNGDLVMDLDLGSQAIASPIVVGDFVYADAGGDLRAFDRLAGGEAWVQSTPHETVATPASTGSLIITRRSDERLYAYWASDGQVEWVRSAIPVGVGGGDLAVADGRIFLSARSGTTHDLVALDAADGSVVFRNTTAGRASMGAPVVAANKILVTEGARLQAFRGQPDLVVDKVVMSRGTATENFANANVTITVRNLGTESVTGVRVRVYDGDPSGTGALIGQSTVGTPETPLAPNALTTFATANRDWTVGQHDVWVVIDRATTETNDANNARAFPIYVQPGPPPNAIVMGTGPYALALLAGFAIGILVLWFPLRRLRELRRTEKEQ